MVHAMKLATKYFDKIKDGEKTIECRLYDEKRKLLHVGDRIQFGDAQNDRRMIDTQIIALHRFPSFLALLEHFPISSFGGESNEQMLADLRAFYTMEDERKYGVLGIEIKLLNRKGAQA